MKNLIIILILTIFSFTQNGTSTIKSEDLLKLRNLQYEYAKRLVRMQELKSEFEKLDSERSMLNVEIDKWINEQAKQQNIDLTKYRFDSDILKFVEIKAND